MIAPANKTISTSLLVVIAILFWVNPGTGIVIASLTLVFIFIFDRKCLKMFSGLGFLIFLLIAVGIPIAVDFSLYELERNVYIIMRGVLIFLCLYYYTKKFKSSGAFSKLKSYLPAQLLELLQLSLNLLPEMQKIANAETVKFKSGKKSPFEFLVNFFYTFLKTGEKLSKSFTSEGITKVIVVTGKIHEGKTTLARRLYELLSSAGYKVSGILSEAENRNGERYAYYALDLSSGKRVKLVTKDKVEDEDSYDKFWAYSFLNDGMKFAIKSLSSQNLNGAEVVFLDEIGAMEIEDRGYSKQIKSIMKSNIPIAVFVIRDQFIDGICEKFSIKPLTIIRTGENECEIISKLTSVNIKI